MQALIQQSCDFSKGISTLLKQRSWLTRTNSKNLFNYTFEVLDGYIWMRPVSLITTHECGDLCSQFERIALPSLFLTINHRLCLLTLSFQLWFCQTLRIVLFQNSFLLGLICRWTDSFYRNDEYLAVSTFINEKLNFLFGW